MSYLNLKIALQRTGRLSKKSTYLVRYSVRFTKYSFRNLLIRSKDKAVSFIFVRDDDIPNLILTKSVELGIVGKNAFEDKTISFIIKRKAVSYYIIYSLSFSSCRLSLAFPIGEPWTGINCLAGKKIATSYPYLLKYYLKRYSIIYSLYYITGSVEASYRSGLSDIIFDVVSTGTTLFLNGLYEAKIVYYSHAYLIQSLPSLSNNKRLLVNKIKSSININIKRTNIYSFINIWFLVKKLTKVIHIFIRAKTYKIVALNNKSLWVLLHLIK